MSFIEHFGKLDDPRSHINKKHELLDIIFLTVVGIVSGAEGWKDIKQFGDNKLTWLRQFRDFRNGIPVDDTIARVISALEPDALLRCFISWVNEYRHSQGKELIAFDGKTLRHSFNGDRQSALHSVSAYAVGQKLVLGQCRSKGKKNEVATVMELIELLELKNSIVTADAMSCLKKVTHAITKKEADYVLQLKANQKKLLTEIKAFIHKQKREQPQLIKQNTFIETDTGHGRIERRRYTQLAITDWVSQRQGWSELKTIIEVNRTRHINGKEQDETAYYISSLTTTTKALADTIRGHWGIENSSHWVLDVTYKEDDSRIRRGDGPENMATFRRFAMNLARLSPAKDSMRGKLKQAAWCDDFREKLLFG